MKATRTAGVTCPLCAPAWPIKCAGEGMLLGTGTVTPAAVVVPVAVAGNWSFAQLCTGVIHTCGLTAEGEALCWG